jgi:hypothetical protein
MSASWQRVLGLMVVSTSLAAGCSSPMKIDVGGTCVLNSDCSQGLVCTWGKCHAACHTSADCPPGESCITSSDQSMVCQLPGQTYCIYNHDCAAGLICGMDQQCRKQCQVDVDCPYGQICTSTQTCVKSNQVDSNTVPDGGVSYSDGALGAGGTGGAGTTGATGGIATTGGATGTTDGSSGILTECLPCKGATPASCTAVPPLTAMLLDFTTGSGFGTSTESTSLNGGTYAWPPTTDNCNPVNAYPLDSTVTTDGRWRLAGTVGPSTAGIGLWFGPCFADFSGYSGIRFTISGDAGPSGQVTMAIPTPGDTAPAVAPNVDCIINSATCTATTCTQPNVAIPVTATAAVQTVPFDSLTTGLPLPSPDPAAITAITWNFGWSPTPYPVEVYIDDIELVP